MGVFLNVTKQKSFIAGRGRSVMPHQDYTLLGIFAIVLIVFGVHVFLSDPTVLEIPKEELGLEEVELIDNTVVGTSGDLVGQAFLIGCGVHKEAADSALKTVKQFEEKAGSYNYDYLQFRAAKRKYERSIDAYLACLG